MRAIAKTLVGSSIGGSRRATRGHVPSGMAYLKVATNHMLANNKPAENAKILMGIAGAA